ncbi:hypothetical protein D0T49_06130 [Paludibacter sp. 221]|uniref:BNR-4 repeat-containing protein n=1 Tax=Paludibacter sp. 221 TaxID=2302939 RepID=UPI0013D189D0|nr:BNR-4 repeat-containing protein [Paludibacter sp. 221]NDV46621.1 hypothetical protein [Paludibacter sp. 221]
MNNRNYFRSLFVILLVVSKLLSPALMADNKVEGFNTLTEDGAWCWFADPRAVYYEGAKKQTYVAWVNSVGDIKIASYNHDTYEFVEKTIHAKLEADDHDVPAILVRKDGRIVVFYSKHQSAGPMHRVISTNPEDISSFSTAYTFYGNTKEANVSYPNPFQVGDEIWLLFRDINWHPTIAVSKDNGQTFTDIKQLVLNGGARPYARYCQSSDGSIHVAVTTGHPRNESKNKIYYFRLKDNKFYKADGTLIKNFTTKGIDLGDSSGSSSEAEIAYNGETNGKGWIWDITVDPQTQHPVMVYASFPSDTDHRYNYAYWDGTKWVNKEIVKAGKWFPQTPAGSTEPEPNYSGGLSMDHENPSVVYLSKQVNGVFEIYKYTTTDKGTTWTATPITANTPANLVNARPIVPRNHKEGYFDVLWMRGTYEKYINKYNTAIVFQMGAKTNEIEKIELNKTNAPLFKGGTLALEAKFTPIIANVNLTWSSSNENVATVANGVVTAVGVGTAKIEAKTVNGKTATCDVVVTEIEYLKKAFFDFGDSSSPVATGAIQVTETTLLQGSSFGWVSPVGLASRNRSGPQDNEKRDFVLGPNPTKFLVYVENGTYKVSILQGDQDYLHDKMKLQVNGEVKLADVSCAENEFILSKFEVVVTNRQMEFEISRHGSNPNWVINSIKLEQISTFSLGENDIEDDFISAETLVTVYDIFGRKITQSKLNNQSYEDFLRNNGIDKEGFYLLHLELGNKEKTFKFYYNKK